MHEEPHVLVGMGLALSVDSSSIVTRSYARELAIEAHEDHESVLDLTNVEFVSRSVADELLSQRERLDLEFRGLDDEAGEMIDAVADSRAVA